MLATLIGACLINDPYLWLEETSLPMTDAWIEEEVAYTNSFFETLFSEKQTWQKRFLEVLDNEFLDLPMERKGLFFSLDRIDSELKKIYLQNQVLIDPGKAAFRFWSPSPDGKYIAYTLSENANDASSLLIFDVVNEKVLPESIPSKFYPCLTSSMEWSPDSKGFWYTKSDTTEKFYHKLYYHRLHTDFKEDPIVFGNHFTKLNFISDLLYTEKGLLIQVQSNYSKADLFLFNLENQKSSCLFSEGGVRNKPFFHQGKIYIPTDNELFVDNKVLYSSKNPIQNCFGVDNFLFIHTLENVHSSLKQYDLEGNFICEIPLPELGTITGCTTLEHSFLFGFTSFLKPHAVYHFDLSSHQVTLFRAPPLKFHPEDFEISQHFYKASDGADVPLFLIHQKNLSRKEPHPLLLYGYGGFGISIVPNFNPSIIPFLERGGIYAIANIRGGGEYGKTWHESGKLKNKERVFNDFINGAEWLISSGYTDSSKLAIIGGSNGGLLTGAMLTQRPDLFKAVIIGVPVLDMLRYHLFFGGAYWMSEYGSPDDPEMQDYLLSYSPYHNIKENMTYPSTLIFTSDQDDRVHPMHAYKMTAKLRSLSPQNPLLLLLERNAGHGGNPSVSARAEFYANIYTFLFNELCL